MESTVDILKEVLIQAHKGHNYISDSHKYDKVEHWEPNLEGDCDDFALWCRDELRKRGIEADLVMCLTETNQGHLVCSVDGWVLDNMYPYVVAKDELRYKWLKIGRNGKWYKVKEDGSES